VDLLNVDKEIEMGYSEDTSMVRVDFFKTSGKWYTTEAVKWTGKYDGFIFHEFAKSLRDHFKDNPQRLSDMDAICLHPYHQHAHPIMIKSGGWTNSNMFV
jgi:hypothetical protein